MIWFLFTVTFTEMAVIMLLVSETPLRTRVILGLDRFKRGVKGPIVVKMVALMLETVLLVTVCLLTVMPKPLMDDGSVKPTYQIFEAKQILGATLMGAILFLALMLDRLHHYLRELRPRRESMEAAKRQNSAFEDWKMNGSDAVKAMVEELSTLRTGLIQWHSEHETHTSDAQAAEANAVVQREQPEGFIFEYDRLREENQFFRRQLQQLDSILSRSGSIKFA